MNIALSTLPVAARTRIEEYKSSGAFSGPGAAEHSASSLEQKEMYVGKVGVAGVAEADEVPGFDLAIGQPGRVEMEGAAVSFSRDGENLDSLSASVTEGGQQQYIYADKNVYVNLMETPDGLVGKAISRGSDTIATFGNYGAIPEMPEPELDETLSAVTTPIVEGTVQALEATIEMLSAGASPEEIAQMKSELPTREQLSEKLTPEAVAGTMFGIQPDLGL